MTPQIISEGLPSISSAEKYRNILIPSAEMKKIPT